MKTKKINNKALQVERKKNFSIFDVKEKKQISAERLYKVANDNPKGFTIDVKGNHIKKGYAVAVKSTRNNFGYNGAKHCIYVFNRAKRIGINYFFGGWYNSENNKFYFDCVLITDSIDMAKHLAKINNQIAVYDLNNSKEIKL